MARTHVAPASKPVTPDSPDPRHRWDRPLQAPGHMQVDFEERVDFRRLHEYRLARTRQALANSKLGALLVFDEVISGFRASAGGAQQVFGVTPDLTCLGKIIGEIDSITRQLAEGSLDDLAIKHRYLDYKFGEGAQTSPQLENKS